LADLVNRCIIRRTSALLTKYLPVKVELVVCCKLSTVQAAIYKKFISSEAIKSKMRGIIRFPHFYININLNALFKLETDEKKSSKGGMTALSAITNLKKLCSHPELIHDKCQAGIDGFEETLPFFPANFDSKYTYSFINRIHVPHLLNSFIESCKQSCLASSAYSTAF